MINHKKIKHELVSIQLYSNLYINKSHFKNSNIFLENVYDCIYSISLEKDEELKELNAFLSKTENSIRNHLANNNIHYVAYILELTLNDYISNFLQDFYLLYPEQKEDIDIVNPKLNYIPALEVSKYNYDPESIANFRKRLDSGIYRKEFVNCACGNDDYTLIINKSLQDPHSRECLCKHCGLIYTNPRFTKESFDIFYQTDFLSINDGYLKYIATDNTHGKEILSFCKNLIQHNFNILDIGCASGSILSSFKESGFTNLTGIDIGEESIIIGKRKGLNLYNINSKEFAKTTKTKFDLIILSHTFEHFLNIEEELNIIKDLLAPNGLLYVEVPSLKYGVLPARHFNDNIPFFFRTDHVSNFTLTTLDNIMRLNEFEILQSNDHSPSRSIKTIYRVNSEVNKDIKNEYFEILNYLKFIALLSNTPI